MLLTCQYLFYINYEEFKSEFVFNLSIPLDGFILTMRNLNLVKVASVEFSDWFYINYEEFKFSEATRKSPSMLTFYINYEEFKFCKDC